MEKLRIGLIGTGRKQEQGGRTGSAMAYQHGAAYQKLSACEMVACADIVEESAAAFAEHFGFQGVFTDYHRMLAEAKPDMVSICTWPHLHTDMVIDAAIAGVKAIHCEKPMSDTWGGARLMAQECERRGVQLTFNHQRRFGAPFRLAKQLLDEGEIGALLRLEASCSNMYDWGTHWIDMMGFYNNEEPAEWVIAQADVGEGRRVFGAPVDSQGIGQWRYRNGVAGIIATGPGAALIGCSNRLVGTDGMIEVGVDGGPALRVRRKGSGAWETIDVGGESLHGPGFIDRAIAEAIASLREGREPMLSARRALNATEIIFACYESSRRRGRVDLPLRIDDNPLEAMLAGA